MAHDSGEAVVVERPRAVATDIRFGDSKQPAPGAFFATEPSQSGTSRSPWSGGEISEALGLTARPPAAKRETSGFDAMGTASMAEVQLAGSLVQLGVAHLQILQTTLLEAYQRAVSSLDAPGVRELAMQIVQGVGQVEHARDQIGPGEELAPLRMELNAAWEAAVAHLAVQTSPQILGGMLVAATPEPPPRPHVVHLGSELIAREARRVLDLLEAAERIRSYVMPESEATSEPAASGDQLLAVAELARFASRPIDTLFLAAILKRTGAWLEVAQARGSDGRTGAQVLEHVEAQAGETGATVELGPKWNAPEAADALSYGLNDWAVTDEDATRVVEMLQAASPQGRSALVKQLHRMGLLERLVANVGWAFLRQIGETLNDPEAEKLLAPHYEGKGGIPSSHQLLMAQVDRNLQEGSALDTFQAGAWYLLDAGLDALSFGGKASIDRAHEARDAGLISEDGFWAEANKAMARTVALGAAATLTGGAAGAWSEGAAIGLGAGEGGAALIGAAAGGAVGNVGARFTGDIYDQLLNGKPGFDSFSAYAQDFASGGLLGAALAPVGLHAAKHLPASARTMAQTYAVRHPHLIPILEAARGAGIGTAFRVRMTVGEWLDVLRTGAGGPGNMGGFGNMQPALAGTGGSVSATAAFPGDIHTLRPEVELWITARPTVDLDAPLARLEEDAPWFDVEAIDPSDGLGDDWREVLGGSSPTIDGMSEIAPLGQEPHQHRLPIAKPIDPAATPDQASSGFWGDENAKGNSPWFSDNEKVNRVTGYKPVQFRDGYPVFDGYAQETVFLTRMNGDPSDFVLADLELARRHGQFTADGTPSKAWAKSYRDMTGQTWHHHQDGRRMQLVPTDLHRNVPHAGGASLARTVHGGE